jgi:hypothetical protein
MIGIKKRIGVYIHERAQIPKSLGQLPSLPGYYNSIQDAWGNPILYSVDESGVVTLTSLGPSGKSGATNRIEYVFPTRGSNGEWLQFSP